MFAEEQMIKYKDKGTKGEEGDCNHSEINQYKG